MKLYPWLRREKELLWRVKGAIVLTVAVVALYGRYHFTHTLPSELLAPVFLLIAFSEWRAIFGSFQSLKAQLAAVFGIGALILLLERWL